jgi:hypothetical protein
VEERMLKMKKLKFLLMWSIIFLLPSLVCAEPSINSYSGNIIHRQDITISGSGFGEKGYIDQNGSFYAEQTPWKWDDFSGGSNGQELDDYLNGWTTGRTTCVSPYADNACVPIYSSNRTGPNAKMSLLSRFPNNTTVYDSNFDLTSSEQFTEAYIDAYVYIEASPPYARNVKMFRLCSYNYKHSISPGHNLYYLDQTRGLTMGVLNQDHSGGQGWHVCKDSNPNPNGVIKNLPDLNDIANRWTHLQIYAKLNTPGVVDGIMKVWINGVKYENSYSSFCMREANETNAWINVGFGKEWYHNDTAGDVGALNYWSNVYIDRTTQRVMLCNNPTFDNSNICEPQILSTWSDGFITTKINLGNLPDSGTAYLFVFDSDNNHNAAGYPVTIGSTEFNCGNSVCNSNENCSTCSVDCGVCLPLTNTPCNSRGDVNLDGKIDISELQTFINRWLVNSQDVSLPEMITAIGKWKRGCS